MPPECKKHKVSLSWDFNERTLFCPKCRQEKPANTEGETLIIKHFAVLCKPNKSAEELADKIETLVKRYSKDGDWYFNYSVED